MTEDPLRKALDIAEALIAAGREREALALLRSRILPALQERLDGVRRAGTGNRPAELGRRRTAARTWHTARPWEAFCLRAAR